MKKRLRLSSRNKKILGVCGGIARYFELDPTIVRILFILVTLLLRGFPILVYFMLWAVMSPDE